MKEDPMMSYAVPRWLLSGACLLLLTLPLAGIPALTSAQTAERCFAETGHCISGPIRAYWERNGGLERFGYPITSAMQETIEGRTYYVQYFERRRMELHQQPSGHTNVLLGLLGREVYQMR
jgi:hypothetical protein